MTPDWSTLSRPTPAWYTQARFGIFIHWGPYSVPAWAEPHAALGTIDDREWFARNPYAEWYWNSLRIEGSPTATRHRRLYGDAPYDDFLDAWHAERFDAAALMTLVARAGAGYVVPTTKHHDGIALWDAPGSGDRNTVARGPRRDLLAEMAGAARAAGIRFGVYYSGGLDWGFSDDPPIRCDADLVTNRPTDARYARYAYEQVVDLIDRFEPAVLFNDIDWPDAGKAAGSDGLFELLAHYRARVPDGVVNDRWGVPFHDVRVSEYEAIKDAEHAPVWEHTRGIGLSFGFNRAEGPGQSLSPDAAVRLLVDVVSRGGNLLLNVGPHADGTLPQTQVDVLEGLAGWMETGQAAIHGGGPVAGHEGRGSDDPWIRWLRSPTGLFVVTGTEIGEILVEDVPTEVDRAALRELGHPTVAVAPNGGLAIRTAEGGTLPQVHRVPTVGGAPSVT